jgi:uncharacterized membrane protein (DUF485 family)
VNPLAAYRDDGPLAELLARPLSRRLPGPGRFGWLGPPLVRAVEYGGLLGLAIAAGPAAVTSCFVLLAVLAYHHYNIVYRLRHEHTPPPRWLRYAGGGWELRLIAAGVLLVTGGLAVGMITAAAVLAGVYVAETVASWQRFGRTPGPGAYGQEEVEGE